MKIIEKKCPNCGGNLDFKVGERDVRCESCRRKFAIEYDTNLADLTEKAKDALNAADISLRPVRKIMLAMIIGFFVVVAVAVTFSIIQIANSRAAFNQRVEESQKQFEETTQEMLKSIGE